MTRPRKIPLSLAATDAAELAVSKYRDDLHSTASDAARRRSADQISAAHVEIARSEMQVARNSRVHDAASVVGGVLLSAGVSLFFSEWSGSKRVEWVTTYLLLGFVGVIVLVGNGSMTKR